jgi:hypothetical protein
LSFEQRQRDRKDTFLAQACAVSVYGTAVQGNDVLDQSQATDIRELA